MPESTLQAGFVKWVIGVGTALLLAIGGIGWEALDNIQDIKAAQEKAESLRSSQMEQVLKWQADHLERRVDFVSRWIPNRFIL